MAAVTTIAAGTIVFGSLFGGLRGCSSSKYLDLNVGDCYTYKSNVFKGQLTYDALIYKVKDIDEGLILREVRRNNSTHWYEFGTDKNLNNKHFIIIDCSGVIK